MSVNISHDFVNPDLFQLLLVIDTGLLVRNITGMPEYWKIKWSAE